MGCAHTRSLFFFSRRFFALGVQTYSLRAKKTTSSSKSGSPPERCIFAKTEKKNIHYQKNRAQEKNALCSFTRFGWAAPIPDLCFSFLAVFSPSAYKRTAFGRRKRRLHRNPAALRTLPFAKSEKKNHALEENRAQKEQGIRRYPAFWFSGYARRKSASCCSASSLNRSTPFSKMERIFSPSSPGFSFSFVLIALTSRPHISL